MSAPLELWFDFASPYSYVGALRALRECPRAGVALVWKPFLLGPIFEAQLGVRGSPFNRVPARLRYLWKDLDRLCAKHGLPWKQPSEFPRNGLLAARVACAAAAEPWLGAFIEQVFRANFGADAPIAQPEVVSAALQAAGAAPGPWLERGSSPEAKALLRANTEAAVEVGIFGAPNAVVRGELWFGQDRLDDALEAAQQ